MSQNKNPENIDHPPHPRLQEPLTNTGKNSDSLHSPQDSQSVKEANLDSATFAQDTLSEMPSLLGLDSTFIYDYITHPVLLALTWPMEIFIVPTIKLALFPMKPPIEYMLKEKVLDRTVDLMSFGKNNQILVYPIVVITTGTGSQTGAAYIHKFSALETKHRLAIKYRFYVNGNQKFRVRTKTYNLFDSRINLNIALQSVRRKNQEYTPPRASIDSINQYSDTTWGYSTGLEIPLFGNWTFEQRYLYRNRSFSLPTLRSNVITCGGYFFEGDDCIERRGLNQKFEDYIYVASIERNTVNNPNIPTTGSEFRLDGSYHYVTKKHNFYEWTLKLVNYIFLGVERYEITSHEQREMGQLNFQKIKENLKVKSLKKKLLKRKVIATQIRLGQVYEIDGYTAPAYALNTMGNPTPLRGYSGSPFRDYALASISAEYRFPIMRLIEGTVFNEYGMVGESINNLNPDGLQNSWGFGVRFSRKDIFLFRAQIGFHGLNQPKSFTDPWFTSQPIINMTIGQVF